MRAAVLRGGRLEVRETPDPVPGPGELLLRTLSTAVCASDIHYMDHPDPDDTSGMFVWDADRDVVMGHEFVGEVVGHGPGCSDQFPLGTRVTSVPTLVRDGGMQVIGQHPDAPGSFGELFLVSELVARRGARRRRPRRRRADRRLRGRRGIRGPLRNRARRGPPRDRCRRHRPVSRRRARGAGRRSDHRRRLQRRATRARRALRCAHHGQPCNRVAVRRLERHRRRRAA